MSLPRPATSVDRPLLDGVLAVVQELGASARLEDVLNLIAEAVVGVLGFGAVAINVATADGDLRVEAVRGPPGVQELLGTRNPLQFWLELLDEAEPWGELRFYGHLHDSQVIDKLISWVRPVTGLESEPDTWYPDDSLFAPLWDGDRLIGVVSVDAPDDNRLPDQDHRTVLEVFAGQAAKAIRDTQAREAAEQHRLEVEHRWRLAFEHSPTGVALVDVSGEITEINDALVAMLGYSREQLLSRPFTEITHPDDVQTDVELFGELLNGSRESYQLEKRYIRADGTIIHGLLHVGSIHDADGTLQTIVSQVSDISERIFAEEQLAYQVTHDQLTGLPSRTQMSHLLDTELMAGRDCGVLFCDMDRFKSINDSLGWDAGDVLLQALARRLQEFTPPHCTLGRVSGDQFVVLSADALDQAAVQRVGEQLMGALIEPFMVNGVQVTLGMSIGATVSSRRHRHAGAVISEAEQALTRAKQRGRGRVQVYDHRLDDHPVSLHDLQLEQSLRATAASGDGLQNYLQSIVSVSDQSVVGAESLIRWRHPVLGLLQPGSFLPLAERSGLIVPLGWRMLELGGIAAAQSSYGWVAVNVAAGQLGLGVLPAAVRAVLAANDISPRSLHLEITETALVDASAEAIKEVRDLDQMGISIALDDFGTGYSSLSLLRDLPISVVKVDRSFVTPIAEDHRVKALVRSLVLMCKALGITTIAEGVETRDQLELISELGCDYIQGYLFARPVPFVPKVQD